MRPRITNNPTLTFDVYRISFESVGALEFAAIKTATPLTEDVAVITPHRLLAQALVDQLRVTIQAIERFDAEISTVSKTLPDYAGRRTPYDESRYLNALKRRGSPLLKQIAATT